VFTQPSLINLEAFFSGWLLHCFFFFPARAGPSLLIAGCPTQQTKPQFTWFLDFGGTGNLPSGGLFSAASSDPIYITPDPPAHRMYPYHNPPSHTMFGGHLPVHAMSPDDAPLPYLPSSTTEDPASLSAFVVIDVLIGI
jgi:hypothetical protein